LNPIPGEGEKIRRKRYIKSSGGRAHKHKEGKRNGVLCWGGGGVTELGQNPMESGSRVGSNLISKLNPASNNDYQGPKMVQQDGHAPLKVGREVAGVKNGPGRG